MTHIRGLIQPAPSFVDIDILPSIENKKIKKK